MRRWLLALTLLSLISVAQVGNAYYELAKPTSFVMDAGQMLSEQTKTQLETDLTNFEKVTSNEIAVVTIPSLQNDTIENFAEKLFKAWGIGKTEKDNGVLLLISKEDRKLRIEVGYGLEGSLTDAQSYWIIQKQITPNFKAGNYDQGVLDGVNSIKKAITGEEVIPQEEPIPSNSTTKRKSFKDLEIFFYLGLFIFIWLAKILSKTKSWWLGGVIGGVIGLVLLIFFVKLITGLILTILLSLAGLLFDFIVSKKHDQSKKFGTVLPWWWGGPGGFGGGSHGGGGFGGFSGGSSGGGGSSGSW